MIHRRLKSTRDSIGASHELMISGVLTIKSIWLSVSAVVASTGDLAIGNIALDLSGSRLRVNGQLVVGVIRPHLLEVVGPVTAEGGRIRGDVVRRRNDSQWCAG